MRTASLTAVALALLCAATPAFATSSVHCRTRAGGPDIWLYVGNEPGTGISQARILSGREEIITGQTRGGPWISQSFLNPRRLSLRVAPGGTRNVILVVTATKRGTPYVGTAVWRGRTFPVRCYWDEDDPE